MSKIIGIVGTRRRNSKDDLNIVESEFIRVYKEGDIICSGMCPKGGDRFAVILQKKYNTRYLWFPPKWEEYGRAVGFIRNTDIARESDILIACVASDRTGGTEDTIKKYLKFGEKNLIIV